MINFNKLNNFAETLKNETNFIDTSNAICIQISQATGYSESTVQSRLNEFKHAMFYSNCINNPLFIEKAKQALSLPDELLFIHYKMRTFLINNGFMQISNSPKGSSDKLSDGYLNLLYNPSSDSTPFLSFTWKIPNIFFPIFTGYVLATTTHKTQIPSATLFFDNIVNYLADYPYLDSYNAWLDGYLGKCLFCNIETLYDRFSKTPLQKKLLHDSIFPLMELFSLPSPEHPAYIINFVNLLLDDYTKQLDKAVDTNDTKSTDLDFLYFSTKPFHAEAEDSILNDLLNSFNNTICNLRQINNEFIKDAERKHPEYPLSIQNLNKFNKRYDDLIHSFSINVIQCNTNSPVQTWLQQYLYQSYNNLYYSNEVQYLSRQNKLILNYQQREKHLTALDTIFSQQYKELEKSCKSFRQKVERSSDDDPTRFMDKDLKEYDYSIFDKKLTEIDEVLHKNINTKFNSLPSFINTREISPVEKWGYYTFDKNTVIRILRILLKTNESPSDTYIETIFSKYEYLFPLKTSTLLLLLDFHELLNYNK
ncbi:hypothetical protein [Blautia producta]|uniref:hypothetical protein n=1 Tax=Blautia producta TaxID=33035 RepID=UPI0031B5D1FB